MRADALRLGAAPDAYEFSARRCVALAIAGFVQKERNRLARSERVVVGRGASLKRRLQVLGLCASLKEVFTTTLHEESTEEGATSFATNGNSRSSEPRTFVRELGRLACGTLLASSAVRPSRAERSRKNVFVPRQHGVGIGMRVRSHSQGG
jgi:hypothetical protein